jgi:probable F420-dependent oxidoreductase
VRSPVLVTPGYTARARTQVGPDTTLAIEQMAVISTDPGRARGIARGPIEFLNANLAYPASYRRMGFTGREITGLGDRLVDALVPWGTPDAVASAISSQLRAGADHVAVSLRDDPSQPYDRTKWRELAERLLPG